MTATWTQLALPGFDLTPTPAVLAGAAYLASCDRCGAVLYVPSSSDGAQVKRSELDPCPVCAVGHWKPVRYQAAAGFQVQR